MALGISVLFLSTVKGLILASPEVHSKTRIWEQMAYLGGSTRKHRWGSEEARQDRGESTGELKSRLHLREAELSPDGDL